MTELTTTVTWVDARERLPGDGRPVAAAITGRYPAASGDSATALGEEFWLVVKAVFAKRYRTEDGAEHHDCFIDSDRVVRFPYSPDSDDSVTHWAELPTLPGQATHYLSGEDVRPALRHAWDTPQRPTSAD
ncbi:AQJ64_40280 family protein [Streptomyces sp. NPDC047046]|uniref:AQJ64_40280 family protein n=1 Tax=Streptomyces sp. NPDC047046 TaxID=3155378 RepID=UPI0033C159EB